MSECCVADKKWSIESLIHWIQSAWIHFNIFTTKRQRTKFHIGTCVLEKKRRKEADTSLAALDFKLTFHSWSPFLACWFSEDTFSMHGVSIAVITFRRVWGTHLSRGNCCLRNLCGKNKWKNKEEAAKVATDSSCKAHLSCGSIEERGQAVTQAALSIPTFLTIYRDVQFN